MKLYIIDLDGQFIEVEDLDAAIAQADLFASYQYIKRERNYWLDIQQKLYKLRGGDNQPLKLNKLNKKLNELEYKLYEAEIEENKKLNDRGFGYAMRHSKINFSTRKSDCIKEIERYTQIYSIGLEKNS